MKRLTKSISYPLKDVLQWDLHDERLSYVLAETADMELRGRHGIGDKMIFDEASIHVTGNVRQSFKITCTYIPEWEMQ